MGVLAHHLEGLSFLLHRIGVVAESIDFDFLGLDFRGLSGCGGFHEGTDNADAGAGGDVLEGGISGRCRCGSGHRAVRGDDNLHVLDGGAIVERDEVNGLTGTVGTYPSFDADVFSVVG